MEDSHTKDHECACGHEHASHHHAGSHKHDSKCVCDGACKDGECTCAKDDGCERCE